MKKIVYGFLVLSCSLALYGCGGEQNTEQPVEAEQVKEFVLPDEEPNTSSMVDALVTQARNDAETATEADLQAAVNFIKDNYPDYYDENEVTEKVMYYGALLQYYFQEDASDLYILGRDALEATKYVYRGAENVETEATQINLESVKEVLDSLS